MSTDAPARVLVADDEASIRFVLRETLEAAGCQVTDVDSGDAAFEELASGRYELAFFEREREDELRDPESLTEGASATP